MEPRRVFHPCCHPDHKISAYKMFLSREQIGVSKPCRDQILQWPRYVFCRSASLSLQTANNILAPLAYKFVKVVPHGCVHLQRIRWWEALHSSCSQTVKRMTRQQQNGPSVMLRASATLDSWLCFWPPSHINVHSPFQHALSAVIACRLQTC